MRSRKELTISSSAVHQLAAALLQQHLGLKDQGYKCRVKVIVSVLLFAASRITSICEACMRLRNAPGDDAVRKALHKSLPDMPGLERRLNAALSDRLPKRLRRRSLRIAIDITEIPYHGKPHREAREICRRRPRAGTSHFHCYATAYVVEQGERFTLALTYVWADDSKRAIVQRLLRQVRRQKLNVRYLLLDRGFYAVDVVRYLQAARCPFLMPVIHCGGRASKPNQSRGTNRFLVCQRSRRATHTMSNKKRAATVQIAVACDDWNGRRGKHGRRVLVFAYWGFQPSSPAWVREEYRKRFGIETSYRQMNQARIRTCTTQPRMRLLMIGLALLLRNLWVWIHLSHLSRITPSGRIRLRLRMLRFRHMLHSLEQAVFERLGEPTHNTQQPHQKSRLAANP